VANLETRRSCGCGRAREQAEPVSPPPARQKRYVAVRQALQPVRVVARTDGVQSAETIGERRSIPDALEQRFRPPARHAPRKTDVVDGARVQPLIQNGPRPGELIL